MLSRNLIFLLLSLTFISAQNVSKEEALKRLIRGNQRYVLNNASMICLTDLRNRREALVKSQSPFAVLICCSDSRVAPEILFDQGLGDLFVIRTAGNIIGDTDIGDVEYALDVLGSRLVVVMGHENCGAVNAAIKGITPTDQIAKIVDALQPAIDKARKEPGDLLLNSILANVQLVITKLKASKPIIGKMLEEGKIDVVGGIYHLQSGEVELFLPALGSRVMTSAVNTSSSG
jgi:carbonic anhydrase